MNRHRAPQLLAIAYRFRWHMVITGAVLLAPALAWVVIRANWVLMAAVGVDVAPDAFSSATIAGLLTLWGFILTIIWSFYRYRLELAEKRRYVIDMLLPELQHNRNLIGQRSHKGLQLSTATWKQVAPLATCLPQKVYKKVAGAYSSITQVLYMNSGTGVDSKGLEQMLTEVVSDLNCFRDSLSSDRYDVDSRDGNKRQRINKIRSA